MKAFIKNFQFIVLLLLVCLPSKADDTNKVTVGLTIDSTAVVAESQSFGRRIEGVVIHSELDYMLLKFRETTKSGKWLQFKGEIGAYSIKDSKLLWTSKEISSRCLMRIRVVSGGKASSHPCSLTILPISFWAIPAQDQAS